MDQGVYIFDLKLLCGGYAYFSTFSQFEKFGSKFREIRKPCLVNESHFMKSSEMMGLSNLLVIDNRSYRK